MAGMTLVADRNRSVEPRGGPSRKSALVAGIAVGHRDATQQLIRDMADRPAIGGWKRATVAGRALVGRDDLAVVELGGNPARRAVAAEAVDSSRDVVSSFAGSCCPVVAARTVGRHGECRMIHLGTRPSRGLVAALAIGHPGVDRGIGLADGGREVAGVAAGRSDAGPLGETTAVRSGPATRAATSGGVGIEVRRSREIAIVHVDVAAGIHSS